MYIAVNDLAQPLGYLTDLELQNYSSKAGETISLHTDRIESLIVQRSNEIDTYLRGRYDLPISLDKVETLSILADICKNLVSYDLVYNRLGSKITESQKNWETKAYLQLDKIVKGEMVILTNNQSNVRYAVTSRSPLLDTTNF